MKWQWSFLAVLLLGSPGLAQQSQKTPAEPGLVPNVLVDDGPRPDYHSSVLPTSEEQTPPGGYLDGTHEFDHFIGFMSNPLFNIDPRAVTELLPITGFTWFNTSPALPNGNLWLVPGAALTAALSDRLSLGINQGGYAVANFDRTAPGLFRDHFGRLENRIDFSGQREGWLNLGGFVQYTVVKDAADQFLVTTGLRWEAPIGSKAIFQGNGPAHLAPYVTAGKGFGDYHVLADLGYEFPTGSDGKGSDIFYGCVHFDRRMFGWLYPLVEFNWIYHTTTVDVDLPLREGFIDLGSFQSTGNLVTLAAGANAVLVQSKLEVGAVYTTSIAAQRDFGFNGFLLKMVLRY
ncbi:MAG TPA: hypothetical protein VGY66_12570 [Gemmataceae bacterium]|jgi:hypothetical protein|nr:hypothetical protein [Gemmataceae bacterium]